MEIKIPENLTKSNIAKAVTALNDKLQNGEIDPLKLLAELKFLETLSKDAIKLTMQYAIDEFDKYGEKEVGTLGVTLRKKEAGIRRDYSNTPLWVEISNKEKEVAGKRKDLEKMLSSLSKSGEFIFEGSDELQYMTPPIVSSTTVIECTLSK